MKKSRLKKFVVYVVIIGVVWVGVAKIRERNENYRIREAEEMSVGALKSTFKDIESVEFLKTVYNNMTGSYSMRVNITSKNGKSAEFSFSYWNNSDEIGSYILKDEEIQNEGVTKKKVNVIYSDGSKGEV